ncbi:MAG: flagellar biosynthesis protein FlhB [Phycisphaerales bacterium]
MAEDLGDKTELPTARRRSEARGRGQVPKSTDLSAAVELAAGVALLALLGSAGTGILGTLMRHGLDGEMGDLLDPGALRDAGINAAITAAWVVGPALAIMFAVAYVAQFLQVGWLITLKPLTPDLNKLNPAAGLKRIFGVRGLLKSAMNSAKLVVVIGVATLVLAGDLPKIAALPGLSLFAGSLVVLRMALDLTLWLLLLLIIMGIVDLIFHRWRHVQDLRMTRQEVKDERRSMDGDPEIKSRRFRMARELLMHKIQAEVPRADVVVTNPTHFSVALRYDPVKMRAPKVVAKGADEMAFHIRRVAIAAGVTIVERPPLARGLYWEVEIGREVPAEFYEAVAEVLAYVYRINGRAA